MFAGIAASSMPTVKLFFRHHKFFESLGLTLPDVSIPTINGFGSTKSTGEKPSTTVGFGQWGYKSHVGDEEDTTALADQGGYL